MKERFLAALFWLMLAGYFSAAAYQLGLGTVNRPEAGFFPFGAAIAMGALALCRLLRAVGETPGPVVAPSESRKIVLIIAGMAAYALLLDLLGFALCTFLLIAAYLKFIADRRWPLSLGFALAVAVSSHLFFESLLRAQLPRGLLGG
jgi:hypothetical protein